MSVWLLIMAEVRSVPRMFNLGISAHCISKILTMCVFDRRGEHKNTFARRIMVLMSVLYENAYKTYYNNMKYQICDLLSLSSVRPFGFDSHRISKNYRHQTQTHNIGFIALLDFRKNMM